MRRGKGARWNSHSRLPASPHRLPRSGTEPLTMSRTASRSPITVAGEVAHRTRAAGGGRCGGDFAVVVSLPDGRVGIGLGDVAGHGQPVSGLMRRLREAMVEEARTAAAPGVVLHRLNARLAALDEDAMATVGYAVLDPAARTVEYASAGHLPFLCLAGGGARPVEGRVGPPLGVCPAMDYVSRTSELPAGATVLAYSDGLVERRGEDIDLGLRRVGDAAEGAAGAGVRRLVDRLFVGLGAASPDDVTLVAVRLAPRDVGRVTPSGGTRRSCRSASGPHPTRRSACRRGRLRGRTGPPVPRAGRLVRSGRRH
jgi:phosphoserine phosphatase RsbU/P